MNEPLITIVGTAVADPELRFLPSGVAVANLTVAVTPRVKKGESWEDGETIWFRCAAWRQLAESVAESITKGTRVIAQGRMSARSYETKSGEKRTDLELQVDAIGPELRFATAKVNRVGRSSGDTSGGFDDAWSTNPSPTTTEDPPF